MKTSLYKRITNFLFITMLVLTITFFLSEFEYIDPIPYNEILFWLTLVVWSALKLYFEGNKK